MELPNRLKESWATRVGVILAVTGSAVGLGNFLRFPGQAAQYGGGAFLIPYIVAFVIVGMPLAWAEWALGRHGGGCGHNSAPGIFRAITGKRGMAYVGMLGALMPVMIYMYYVFVEAWCLAYAWDFMTGHFARLGNDAGKIEGHFAEVVGAGEHGLVFTSDAARMLLFLGICFVVNFVLIYRGISGGIEKFCNIAMPLLVICAVVVLIRVLTLPANPEAPNQNLINGMGYMWNPVHDARDLAPSDERLNKLLADGVGGEWAADPEQPLVRAAIAEPAVLADRLREDDWKFQSELAPAPAEGPHAGPTRRCATGSTSRPTGRTPA